MKNKILFLVILLFSIIVNGQIKKSEPIIGVLKSEQLSFLKSNYTWGDEDYLFINYVHSRTSCHYDTYSDFKKSQEWWKSYYEKLNIPSSRVIFVFKDAKKHEKYIDDLVYFEDKDHFLTNTFFPHKGYCYSFLAINKNGIGGLWYGEYRQETVKDILNKISKAF